MPDAVVLDSSAVLALIQNEPGSEKVKAALASALLSSVNLCEIHSKLIGKGIAAAESWNRIATLQCDVCAFTSRQGRAAAEMIQITRRFGLSLGDRACLALAMDRKAKVYTADRAWKNLSLGIEVEVIR